MKCLKYVSHAYLMIVFPLIDSTILCYPCKGLYNTSLPDQYVVAIEL
jgi:hypothetical protein